MARKKKRTARGSSKSRTPRFERGNARANRAPRSKQTAKQREQHARLKEAIQLLRRHIHGYEAKDGYSLPAIGADRKKRKRVIRRAAKLKELTATPFDTVKATTKKARRNLQQFTRQKIRGAKHFIVHKPADNFKIRIDHGHVSVQGKFKGRVVTRSDFYLFPRKPRYPKELVSMANRLRKEMRPGFYTLLTAAHGDTGEPFDRDAALQRLEEYLAAYTVDQQGRPTGFAEALIGFRFMSTTLKGASSQRQSIDARRQAVKKANAQKRKQWRTKPKKPRRKK